MIQVNIQRTLHGVQGDFDLNVDLDIVEGEFVALFGPSGVGKTTLLRCLAGLEKPDRGRIAFNGSVWFDAQEHTHVPPQERHVGYMFQDYALFPNMTVRGNLEFARRKGSSRQRVDELLELMDIAELQHRKPNALSGGQKQRVALARALAAEPQLLLLDEPLSSLDPTIRSRLQDEILQLHQRMGISTIMVSHDVGEVYKLAGRVLVMEAGHIVRQGSPAEVFSSGQTTGKFRFTGEVLGIEPMDVMEALTVLVGNQIVRVAAMPDEASNLHVGARVMLVSKAFNPMIIALE
ncbi:molybdate transport system ATP-binding protein [Novimethylophilus kurashikiensis]|uniref:Molybdate transport system ATP-binding protein n=1 Tax=Novimethylophilus kurashikiensis TaxID=1825523 RepID=A0A2R5F8V4_9PROT|nr:ATP-binding cassette domain-containing protein [Novimethylophilus kurashikiensis]GBG14670.1 molybdate transport system ATP-binding protein [Novimethylophilus kurashikiensis]